MNTKALFTWASPYMEIKNRLHAFIFSQATDRQWNTYETAVSFAFIRFCLEKDNQRERKRWCIAVGL